MAKLDGLRSLVYYAIDRASPYDLALHEDTDALEKIEKYTIAELQITSDGIGLMWQIINGYASRYGGRPVPASVALTCKTAGSVWAAVHKAAGQ